jgi:hypothetical protein
MKCEYFDMCMKFNDYTYLKLCFMVNKTSRATSREHSLVGMNIAICRGRGSNLGFLT